MAQLYPYKHPVREDLERLSTRGSIHEEYLRGNKKIPHVINSEEYAS